jgi:hypothetical protein
MRTAHARKGIYVSYNKQKNGRFQEAVDISNERGYLIWLERSPVNPREFLFPIMIVIRIAEEDRYYQGKLIAVHRREEVDPDELLRERGHRPEAWVHVDQHGYADFQSVFYFEG